MGSGDEDKKERNKRKQVKKACLNCRKGHRCCEDTRPCKRCSRMGLTCEEGTGEDVTPTPAPKKTRAKSQTVVHSTARPILLHQVNIEQQNGSPKPTAVTGPAVPWFKRDADPFVPQRYPDLTQSTLSNSVLDVVSRAATSLGTGLPHQVLAQHLQQQQHQHAMQQQYASPSSATSSSAGSTPADHRSSHAEEGDNVALTDSVGLTGFLSSFMPSSQNQQQFQQQHSPAQAQIHSPHSHSPHTPHTPHTPQTGSSLSSSVGLSNAATPLSSVAGTTPLPVGSVSLSLPGSSLLGLFSESVKLGPPPPLTQNSGDLSLSSLRDSFFNMKDSFLNTKFDPGNLRDSVGKTAPQLHLSNSLGFAPGVGMLSNSSLIALGAASVSLDPSLALAPVNLPADPTDSRQGPSTTSPTTNASPTATSSTTSSSSSTSSRDPPTASVH